MFCVKKKEEEAKDKNGLGKGEERKSDAALTGWVNTFVLVNFGAAERGLGYNKLFVISNSLIIAIENFVIFVVWSVWATESYNELLVAVVLGNFLFVGSLLYNICLLFLWKIPGNFQM